MLKFLDKRKKLLSFFHCALFASLLCLSSFCCLYLAYNLKNNSPTPSNIVNNSNISTNVNTDNFNKKKQEPLPLQKMPRFNSITKENRSVRIPVLMYHDIQDVEQSDDGNIMPKWQFEEQLKLLKDNGFTTITAQEFIDAYHGRINLPKKSIMITIDDGFQSVKTIINPLLKQYDMYAVSFIIGSYIDRPQWHLTADDIKEIQKDQRIDIESHSFDLHKDGNIKGIINETPINDIISDNQKLEIVINHKTNFFCYPFGAFSENAIEGLKAANIQFGFAITSGNSTWIYLNETHTTPDGESQNPFALPRVRINANTPISSYLTLITDDE